MNETNFLLALEQSPGDQGLRMILADWLDEVGQGARAELLRLVCRLRNLPVMEATEERASAEARVVALITAGVLPVVPTIENDLGMRLALIPPGRFRMGSPPGERDSKETSDQVEAAREF